MTLLLEVEVGVWACVNSPGDGRGSNAVWLTNMFALDLLLGNFFTMFALCLILLWMFLLWTIKTYFIDEKGIGSTLINLRQ